jgi:hypothetical protein
MIYNQKQAIFVALAGLLTSATAAPAHHAKTGHTSELIAPGEKPVDLAGRIDKDKYPPACHEAWEFFTQERCWCFTGCALDCSDGRSPGSPGKTMHPEWCKDLTDDEEIACEELACDLVNNCDEVADDLKPGLDKIVSTGGYTCPTASIHNDVYRVGGYYCAYAEGFDTLNAETAPKGRRIDFLFDGKVVSSPASTITNLVYNYKHYSLGTYGGIVCNDYNTEQPKGEETPGCDWTSWGTGSSNWENCGPRFTYQLK